MRGNWLSVKIFNFPDLINRFGRLIYIVFYIYSSMNFINITNSQFITFTICLNLKSKGLKYEEFARRCICTIMIGDYLAKILQNVINYLVFIVNIVYDLLSTNGLYCTMNKSGPYKNESKK